MLSSHVLEQDLSKFSGKRVALVDDTLILGSTLGIATRQLRSVGAQVSSYVLAIDKDNWLPELAQPDRSMMVLEHTAMLTLCANGVEALAVAGIPYLADFPVTRPLKLTRRRLDLFHALQKWIPFPLTSERQAKFGTLTFSILPTDEATDRIETALGPLANLTDISKIRAYALAKDGEYWFRFVPITTVKPLPVEKVEGLWEGALDHAKLVSTARDVLNEHLKAPKAKLRFLQYCASVHLGRVFGEDLRDGVGLKEAPRFDGREAGRLFGPWLVPAIDALHRHEPGSGAKLEVAPSRVPEEVEQVSREELLAVVSEKVETSPAAGARNVFTDLSRAFTQLYHDHEIPARKEARLLGPAIFDADASIAPHRDRLEYGIAWDTLVDCMLRHEAVRTTPQRSNRLSLLLDVLIDMGIAVPVLCERDGILFRAYRHGEDVLFADQEAALAHDILRGFCESYGRSTIPRLVCEKLLVGLFRVGVSKGFLRVVHGIGGGERVARIGFHLHGALPFVPMDDTIFAENHDSWLSTYLTDQGVIAPAAKGGYLLGTRPEAALPKPSSEAEAHQLGWLIGRLMRDKMAGGEAVLDNEALVLLTSCPQSRDAASAVVAERRIFLRWFSDVQRLFGNAPTNARKLRGRDHIDWTSYDSVRAAQRRFAGPGYQALHSGRLKLCGHAEAAPQAIYARCFEHLQTLPGGAFFAAHWRGDWAPIVNVSNVDQSERFGMLLSEMELELFNLAIGTFSIELALLSAEAALSSSSEVEARYSKACAKVLSFLLALRPRLNPPPEVQKAFEHLHEVAHATRYMPAPARACDFGMKLIEKRRHMVTTLIRRSNDKITDYGALEPRTIYSHSLWYDIIDSTGQKSGLRGDALRAYRDRIRRFKKRVAEDIGALIRAAAQQNGNVYCWNAPLGSADDEKNIFFEGRRALSFLRDASELLLRSAKDLDVHVRMLMINGDFAGEAPHKYSKLPYVEGEAYWEAVSRVKSAIKPLEAALSLHVSRSVIWVAQDIIPQVLDTFPHLAWVSRPESHTVTVEIENYPIDVLVCGGPVLA